MASNDKTYRRSFDAPDDTRTKGGVQIEILQIGEIKAKRATYPPGWRFSKDMGAERCYDTHVGYLVSGRSMSSSAMAPSSISRAATRS